MSENLISHLQTPSLYPHPVSKFTVVETHISWVILTGDFAYKIKKPMNFGFLDFTTLEKRAFYCNQELQLNQRLAPELYMEVITITGSEENPQLNGTGNVIDYAIKMRQFSQEQLFSELEKKHQLTDTLLLTVTEQLADFHGRTPQVPLTSPFGSPETIFAPVAQNFEQIKPLLDNSADLKQLDQLSRWAHDTFERIKPDLIKRKAQGFIRECHGDVHLGNVALYNNKPIIFDCIEFNDEFRLIDTLSDVAFLIMDLEDKGLFEQAALCLNRYGECTGDYAGLSVLRFYQAYRAMVRAKVNLFRMTQSGLTDTEKQSILAQYRRYTTLAENYTHVTAPRLFIMHGLSGSGKSTVSSQLVKQLGAIRLRSDIERKRLFNMSELARTQSHIDSGIYTQTANVQTYQHLLALTQSILIAGYCVVVDAAFLSKAERTQFKTAAENMGIGFLIVSCTADESILKNRIIERAALLKDASEATVEVLQKQIYFQETLTADEQAYSLILNTENPTIALQAINELVQTLQANPKQ